VLILLHSHEAQVRQIWSNLQPLICHHVPCTTSIRSTSRWNQGVVSNSTYWSAAAARWLPATAIIRYCSTTANGSDLLPTHRTSSAATSATGRYSSTAGDRGTITACQVLRPPHRPFVLRLLVLRICLWINCFHLSEWVKDLYLSILIRIYLFGLNTEACNVSRFKKKKKSI